MKVKVHLKLKISFSEKIPGNFLIGNFVSCKTISVKLISFWYRQKWPSGKISTQSENCGHVWSWLGPFDQQILSSHVSLMNVWEVRKLGHRPGKCLIKVIRQICGSEWKRKISCWSYLAKCPFSTEPDCGWASSLVTQLPGGPCLTTRPLPHGKHFTPPDNKSVFKEQEKCWKMTQ